MELALNYPPQNSKTLSFFEHVNIKLPAKASKESRLLVGQKYRNLLTSGK
jgi:hypothetical protein